MGGPLQQTGAAALAGDLHQPEAGDLAHLDAGAIVLQAVLHLLFDGAVVLRLIHVDEVDDDQTGQVAQAHLAGGLGGRLHVGLERRGLDVALPRGLAGVHVDGDQGLGLVDHQIAAGLQRHDGGVQLRQLVLHPVPDEERRRLLVLDDLLGLGGHDHPHEVAGLAIAGVALHLDGVDVLVEHVAERPLDQVLLLVDQRRRDGLQGLFADALPQAQQVFVVPLDLRLGAGGAGGTHDQPHALRHVQGLDGALQALAVGGHGDLAADPAAPGGVGHQHAIASGQGQVGGERRALVAALFLDDLHQHDLAALDDFLDLVATHQTAAAALDLLLHHVIVVVIVPADAVLVLRHGLAVIGGGGAGPAAAAGRRLVLFLGFLAQQGFAVGHGDLVVVRMDLVEGEEPVAIAAIFDERGLEAGFYAGDLGEIDIAPKLLAGRTFEIEFLNPVSVHHHNTRLFGVCGVDQHSLGHQVSPCGARLASSQGAGVEWSRAQARLGVAVATRKRGERGRRRTGPLGCFLDARRARIG